MYPQKARPFPLLKLPRELRNIVLREVIPYQESINVSRFFHYPLSPQQADSRQLSQLDEFTCRESWDLAGRPRCDLPILSVNKQLYEESCEILYSSNFVIEINCGLFSVGQLSNSLDPRYRGTTLGGHFPFHRAREITLRLLPNGECDPDHLFNHMLYVCGLLYSEAKYVRHLRLEIVRQDSYFHGMDKNCPSWRSTGCIGIAKRLGFELTPESKTEYIDFLLRPLELPGRVRSCEMTVSEDFEEYITPELQSKLDRYKQALTDQKPFSYEEITWLWDEYIAILDRKEQIRRQRRNTREEEHEAWLLNTHKSYPCIHRRRVKQYHRYGGRKAKCNGCGCWLTWLLDCRQCDLRACKSCMKELKEKRPSLEEAVRLVEWNQAGSK